MDNKKYALMIVDIEQYLDVNDAEDIFIRSVKRDLAKKGITLDVRKVEKLEFIWQKVAKKRCVNG